MTHVEPGRVTTHRGSCHCGAIRFEVEIDTASASMCNCSVCFKVGARSAIVKPGEFRLLTDESKAACYEWGGKTSRRYFCASCGVTCYGRGHLAQLGGDYVSINFNALDDLELSDTALTY